MPHRHMYLNTWAKAVSGIWEDYGTFRWDLLEGVCPWQWVLGVCSLVPCPILSIHTLCGWQCDQLTSCSYCHAFSLCCPDFPPRWTLALWTCKLKWCPYHSSFVLVFYHNNSEVSCNKCFHFVLFCFEIH